MNKKNYLTLLIAVLVVQAALIVYLYRPGQNHAAPAVTLMDSIDATTVSSMSITDESGSMVTLTRQGSDWFVGEDKFPADQAVVESSIKKISALESARLVSRTKSSHNRLKVGEELFNRKVDIVSNKGESTFFMGTAPSAKSVHLRVAGQDEVYQVAGLSAWELQPEVDSWWQSKYVQLDPDVMQAVTISNEAGTISLKREGDPKQWQFAEGVAGEIDQKKASALVSAISNISIAEYLNKDFSIETKPVCTITYQLDRQSIVLQVWPKSEDNDDHVAKLSTAAFYTKIRAYIIKEALGATTEGLMLEVPVQGASPGPAAGQEAD